MKAAGLRLKLAIALVLATVGAAGCGSSSTTSSSSPPASTGTAVKTAYHTGEPCTPNSNAKYMTADLMCVNMRLAKMGAPGTAMYHAGESYTSSNNSAYMSQHLMRVDGRLETTYGLFINKSAGWVVAGSNIGVWLTSWRSV